jgi:hypothetical protein
MLSTMQFRKFCLLLCKNVNQDLIGGHVVVVGEINAYRILVSKPEVKRPLGRRLHRWEYSIKWILGK